MHQRSNQINNASNFNLMKITDLATLESGEYYRINGTKKILYWDGEKWMKPAKDNRGSYSGWITALSTQPKVKFVELSSSNEIGLN